MEAVLLCKVTDCCSYKKVAMRSTKFVHRLQFFLFNLQLHNERKLLNVKLNLNRYLLKRGIHFHFY
ncbi:hypothetical protein SAMN04489723_1242 [Algoriphagus aquimarinus]|uniref:Uncharacterized protein n=1 Tax=Algoriphagus aquimarinus TaxID=237018 RepID=A0A1I1C8R0_9BACT|nr:hypothetical protein SAMN04489723_1242 [Algoriphagus aquimarinus]